MRTNVLRCLSLMLLLAAGCKKDFDDIQTPLHRAVARRDANEVQLLLQRGVDVDAKDFSGKTPLHIAAMDWHADMISLLLDNGANINALDKWGYSVLHRALHDGRTEVAELLLARGAYVRTQSQSGETPLHDAARSGRVRLVKQLVAKGADVNMAARNGDTPLFCAMASCASEYYACAPDYEHMQTARFLIARGANVNAMNKAGETPLSLAAKCGNLELAQLLVDNGAQPNHATTPDRAPAILAMNHNHVDMAKFLAARGADVTLHLAAYIGDLERAQALIQGGSDVNACSQALYTAAGAGHRDIAELLIDSGADVNAASPVGWTPLHEAASHGHKDVAELLIARGAAVNAKTTGLRMAINSYGDTPGTTALHLAVQYPEVVKVLIANGADLNAKEEYHAETPIQRAIYDGDRRVVHLLATAGADMDLNLAAFTGYAERVKRLIDAGADVNTQDDRGWTPLRLAVVGGHADVVELLASSGANPNVAYDDDYAGGNQTLLHKAAQMDNADVVRVLIAHGANIRAQDSSGDTPLHTAAYFGSTSVVEVLLAHGAYPNARTVENKTAPEYAQEAGFADVARLLGGDAGKLARGPYRVIITDPNAVRAFVGRGMSVDEVWSPDETQLKEFEVALKRYLPEHTTPNGANEHVLAHLRRFHREYAGLTSKGKRYIVCNLDLGELDKDAPDNHFTHDHTDAWWTITHVVFDLDAKTIIRVDPT